MSTRMACVSADTHAISRTSVASRWCRCPVNHNRRWCRGRKINGHSCREMERCVYRLDRAWLYVQVMNGAIDLIIYFVDISSPRTHLNDVVEFCHRKTHNDTGSKAQGCNIAKILYPRIFKKNHYISCTIIPAPSWENSACDHSPRTNRWNPRSCLRGSLPLSE